MANRRYTEPRAFNAVWVWDCDEIDRSCAGGSTSNGGIGFTACVYTIYTSTVTRRCHLLTYVDCVAGPLPSFSGLNIDVPTATSPPPTGPPLRVPPLNPDDVAKFSALFNKSDTQNGYISGTRRV